jgi:uncharacterized protein (DUF488 family)
VKIYTIGFTQSTAKDFFQRLVRAQVKRVVDVRLNNTSQLAGFAKAKDLEYFLKEIGGIDYFHEPSLAPTQDMLDDYKKKKGDWLEYEKRFFDLMERRKVDQRLDPGLFDDSCLLCSEAKPHNCHRRLVLEFLKHRWNMLLEIKHL